jgi:L-threonylcarbamoyladenylate synthase
MLSAFEVCIRAGRVALFPADTVYGLACDAENEAAVEALYALKGRAPDKPAAVMFFDMAWLPPMPARTAELAHRLLPGPVTLLIPNPDHHFPLACGPVPDVLGVRVPASSPLRGAQVAVLQSSANHAGGPDPRTLDEVPDDIRRGAKLVLGAGELPGTPSTVLDLTRFEDEGAWSIVRAGALPEAAVAETMAHFGGQDPH